MNTYICKSCGKKQYSAAKTDEPCIYCGKGPVEIVKESKLKPDKEAPHDEP
jgi:ribosomal protein L37E